MDLSKVYQTELDKINELIELVKKNGKEIYPSYVCDVILESTEDPYDFLCWYCSRQQEDYRIGVRCSWAKFGAKIGNKYSPLFGMTGLEILEKVKEEIEANIKKKVK